MKIRCYVLSSTVAFARVASNFWIKTHGCVGRVSCEYCNAEVGDPCRNKDGGPSAETHYVRRRVAAKLGPIRGIIRLEAQEKKA